MRDDRIIYWCSTGGGVKVGEFIDPVCGGSPPQGGLTQLEQRWSSLAGLTGFGSSDHVVLPARAAWLLDASMTVSTFTIRGSFRWDTSVDNLILSAGYVVVERGGSFELGTFEAPMLLRATIHILNLANVSHPYLGRRFLAIDGLSSSTLDEMFFAGGGQEMEEITVTLNDEAIEPGQTVTILHNGANVEIQVPQDARVGEPFQITVPKIELVNTSALTSPPPSPAMPLSPAVPPAPPSIPSVIGPPVLNIHGRPLYRTWTLLAHSAPRGASQLILKHDAQSMGWRVGDGVGMATTQNEKGYRGVITAFGEGGEWALKPSFVKASTSSSDASKAFDESLSTHWKSSASFPSAAAESGEWLLARLPEPSVITRVQVLWDAAPMTYELLVRNVTSADDCEATVPAIGTTESGPCAWTVAGHATVRARPPHSPPVPPYSPSPPHSPAPPSTPPPSSPHPPKPPPLSPSPFQPPPSPFF